MNAHSPSRPTVMLLFGGRSAEHSVSCVTAGGVLQAIDTSQFDVVAVGVGADGSWTPAAIDPDAYAIVGGQLPRVEPSDRSIIPPTRSGDRTFRVLEPDGTARPWASVDVVFPLLHGPYGEDGTVQGMLELVDLPYVGSGVLASALGMDKAAMKMAFAQAGLDQGPYLTVTQAQWDHGRAAVEQAVAQLGFPVFVKPARAGSSFGITKVVSLAGLELAMAAAHKFDAKVVIEAGLEGREVECAVLEGRDGAAARTTWPGEITVDAALHDFYDFEAKYLDPDAVHLIIPACLPDAVAAQVRHDAALAFTALGCEGLARVDFFVTDAGRVLINEINTMPGFTPFSMYPQLWAAAGIAYPDLITELIQLALARPSGLR